MSILFFAPWKNDDSEIQLRFSTFSSTADYWTSELHWHEYFGYPFIQSYAGEAFDELIEKFELLQESLGMVEKTPLSGCSGLRAAPGAYCFICSRALRVVDDQIPSFLRESGMPIGEIASSVGYNSVSLFYRHFRRCFDSSPNAIRKVPESK